MQSGYTCVNLNNISRLKCFNSVPQGETKLEFMHFSGADIIIL